MGVKRPLEAEGFSEISFKQPKPIGYNEKLTSKTEECPSQASTPKADTPGVDKSRLDESLENCDISALSPTVNELEARAELCNVASSSSDQEAESEEASLFHNFPPYFDYSIPWKPPVQFEDPYAYLLNSSPRKEIPIGKDHQAEVPEWDSNSNAGDPQGFYCIPGKESSTGPSQRAENRKCDPSDSEKDIGGLENSVDKEEELRLMGTCIIPMPSLDDSDINRLQVGSGRIDCSCLDMGSTRCVQQHVKEAREKLKETLGEEIFTKLGFYEMGEEMISSRWNPDEQQMFHEVIYSNPAKHGKDFWNVLRFVFPTRSKKEIVSYYFNVFMLWKRAVQNRSDALGIDSDDDEDPEAARRIYPPNKSLLYQESDDDEDFRNSHDDGFYLVQEEDDDEDHHHVTESFNDRDLDDGWVDNIGTELINGDVGENNGLNNETSELESLKLEKFVDHNDVIDNHVTTIGDDFSDDAVHVEGDRSQEYGDETEKSIKHCNFDS